MRKIEIRQRHVEVTEELRAHVKSRIGFALARFGDRIGRVVVRFSDTGAYKRCQIGVDVQTRLVWAEDTDTDVLAAVDHAAQRLSRSVALAFEAQLEGHSRTIPRPASGRSTP